MVWNSIHPGMHGMRVDMPLSEGPSGADIRLHRANPYYLNHKAHHHVKGADKGNFNVVFLGADELFATNRMSLLQSKNDRELGGS
jgi:hypothetical protein